MEQNGILTNGDTPSKSARLISDTHLANQIYKLCAELDQAFHDLKYERCVSQLVYQQSQQICAEHLGFSLEHRPKENGVFISNGVVPRKHLVAFYPGTIYHGYDPALSSTVANRFIYRCDDGTVYDGCNFGTSKLVFKSCSFRSRTSARPLTSDQTWLTTAPVNPLAVGQFVQTTTDVNDPVNVYFHELTLPLESFPQSYLRYIPNVKYQDDKMSSIKLLVLVSLTDIQQGEQLVAHIAQPIEKPINHEVRQDLRFVDLS